MITAAVSRFSDTALSCDREGGGESPPPAVTAGPLPCLSSNICNEEVTFLSGEGGSGFNQLTPGHKRIAHVLALEIQELAKVYGIQRIGFLTLTFADNVRSIKIAQKRFHSLCTGVLKRRYERSIGVLERQKSGRVHFHLVVVLGADIRTGFDFEAIQRQDYRSANAVLRAEWAFWRKTAPKYRFGRTELLPVRSTAEGIARYVGKYISKHVGQRWEEDKGAKFVRFIGYGPGDRKASTRFAWATPRSALWRRKLAMFAREVGAETMDDLQELFGSHWAYLLAPTIMSMDLERENVVYPKLSTDPIWNVPWWADNFPTFTPAEHTAESVERMREMRLYALRLEPVTDKSQNYA